MKIVKYIMIAACVVLFVLTAIFTIQPVMLISNSEHAVGEIVRFNQNVSSHRSTGHTSNIMTSAPVIEYMVDEKKYTYESKHYTNFSSYKIGDTVDLLYNKTNPSEAKINSFMELWLIPVILGGAFVLIFVVTLIILSALRKFSGGSKKLMEQKMHIAQNGTETEGIVTFVDKNYSMLVNNKPIYSIVEYTFQDKAGTKYVRRIDNLNSDLVIQKQIKVNEPIRIKYLPEDPNQSVIMFD